MHGQPRGPLTLPEEVIQFETGRTTDNWCVLLDASNAQSFTHAQLIEHLEHIYGLETRWASTVAVRYEAERGIAREVYFCLWERCATLAPFGKSAALPPICCYGSWENPNCGC
jgi:hypothetical protein